MPAKVVQMQPDKYLTGRRRFRMNDYEDLVLQVEKAVFTPGREGQPGVWKCYWFDASITDVGKEELA